jgi:hypothetical protein
MHGRRLRAALGALLVSTGLITAGHAAAPTARAECTGGTAYTWAVAHARAAVVGTIATTDADLMGFARSIRVERAYGITTGPVLRGQFWPGDACNGDEAKVGLRVVVLLGVPFPGVYNAFFTIGKTVTPWQAAHIGRDLPDTATEDPAASVPGSTAPAPWPLAAVGIVATLLLFGRQRRRGSST